MSSSDAVYYKFTNLTASALIQEGHTKLGGIFCASSTAGTAKIWNNTAASGAVCVNTFTLVAGTYYSIPADMKNGCYITIGGTTDVTVFYQ
jgi:hypothetical protein